MRRTLLPWLRCPDCGAGGLQVRVLEERAGDIESGGLACAHCRRQFPIVRSIPRFVPADNYAATFGFQWNRFRRTQLDSYTGTTISRDRFFRETGWTPAALGGAAVLDVGCGAGRFAQVALSAGAHVIALDYSDAVDACWQNLGPHPRLHVLQADLQAAPLEAARFDFAYCFGVLQHTPDARAAFLSLPRFLKVPDGRLAVDVYERSWKARANPKYLLRPLTTRLPHTVLFRLVEQSTRPLLACSRALGRIPRIGRVLRRAVPVADYAGVYPLDDRLLYEWAVLDTFDMLSPRYDSPQTAQALREWFEEAGMVDVEVLSMGTLVGRGRRGERRRSSGDGADPGA